MHIGIFGHYGNENLGDEAIVEATISSVRRHFPNARVSCFSVNPVDTADRHGVEAFPIRRFDSPRTGPKSPDAQGQIEMTSTRAAADRFNQRIRTNRALRRGYMLLASLVRGVRTVGVEVPFLVACYRRLKGVDLLLIAGSNQLADFFGGTWAYPYTLLKWSLLAKLTGTKVAFVSVGAGPLDARLSKVFVVMSLVMAAYVSYRDQASRDLIEGGRRAPRLHGKVFPDLARNLEFTDVGSRATASGKPVVGVNPMPIYSGRYWFISDERLFRKYVQVLAGFVAYLRENQYPVFLFSTQKRDEDIIDEILAALPRECLSGEVWRKKAQTTQDLMQLISEADICIATRFHGTVLSLLAGVPVIGIGYHRKTGDLLREMGQGDFQVPVETIELHELVDRFHRLEKTIEASRETIAERGAVARQLLEAQYATLSAMFA